MNVPLKSLIGMLQQSARPSRIERLLAQSKAGTAAVMAEVEAMRPELRRRREEDQHGQVSDVQFDRDQYLDECGTTASEERANENPLQSSATSWRY
jgi:hypothetical protein